MPLKLNTTVTNNNNHHHSIFIHNEMPYYIELCSFYPINLLLVFVLCKHSLSLIGNLNEDIFNMHVIVSNWSLQNVTQNNGSVFVISLNVTNILNIFLLLIETFPSLSRPNNKSCSLLAFSLVVTATISIYSLMISPLSCLILHNNDS